MRGSILDWSKARARRLALAAGIAAALAVPSIAPAVASAHPRAHAQQVRRAHLARFFGHKVG